MDYTSLQSDVADWLARGDLTAQVPNLIAFAQHRIYRKLRHRKMERAYLATLDADNRAALPTDFIEVKDFFVFKYSEALPTAGGATMPLEEAKMSQIEPVFVTSEQDVYQNFRLGNTGFQRNAQETGRVRYTIIRQGDEFLVRPPATDLPSLGGMYYAKLELLSGTNLSNFLTDDCPDLLLRACCLEGSIYIKNTEAISYWEGLYKQALGELSDEADKTEYSGGYLAPRLSGP